jgi:hypothetical protein
LNIKPENSVSALLTLLARILLLLARLVTAALLLAWLLAGILALLAGVLVRIVLIAHIGISIVKRKTNGPRHKWFQRNLCSLWSFSGDELLRG